MAAGATRAGAYKGAQRDFFLTGGISRDKIEQGLFLYGSIGVATRGQRGCEGFLLEDTGCNCMLGRQERAAAVFV